MNDSSQLHLWSMRAVFIGMALLILVSNLLPLQTVPRLWAGPDLLFCLAMAWSVRRPDFVPLGLLAGVFLLADLLLSRPPGLAAALMLIACFDLQTRKRKLRDSGFLAEWLRAAALIVLVMVAGRIVQTILIIPLPSLSLTLFQTVATLLAYPVVVAISAIFFGVRVGAPGDIDSYGHRI